MTLRRTHLLTILGVSLVAGCSTPSNHTSGYQIKRTTTDQTLLGARQRGATGAFVEWSDDDHGTVDLTALVREVKIVARRKATARQREVTVKRAAAAYSRLAPERKIALKRRDIRYLAVETERDDKSQGRKSVMLWDTYSSEVVGNNVYDVAESPAIGTAYRFDTYSASYVGAGL